MLTGMNILCLECSQASDFVAHYRQAEWGLGATFGPMIALLNGLSATPHPQQHFEAH